LDKEKYQQESPTADYRLLLISDWQKEVFPFYIAENPSHTGDTNLSC